MGKGRNVTTDNFFTSLFLAKELKEKKTSLVGTMNKVRRELPVSAKCLQQRYSSKLMKAGDMATLTVYQCKPKKNVCVLSSLHMAVELGKLRKRNRKQWNFITRRNVMLTWLIKWPGSIQSKQAPVGGLLLSSTTFWIWQASMHLRFIKKEQVIIFQDEISCSNLLQNYVKTTSLKDQTETLLLLDLTNYRQLLKTPKLRSVNNVK